jgi:Domain of unknown function (DUF5666)
MRILRVRPETLTALSLAAALLAGCSSGSSTVSPSGLAGTSGTLSGTVVGGAASGAAAQTVGFHTLGAGPSGYTVTIVGTDLSALTDASGAFVIEDIPVGSTLILHFSGSGVDATLSLDGSMGGDVRHITVKVDGDSAELEDDDHAGDTSSSSVQEIEGLISAINPAGPSITVNGLLISVPGGTPITHGSTSYVFADLQTGDRVHVKATMVGGVLTAQDVNLQNGAATPGHGNK